MQTKFDMALAKWERMNPMERMAVMNEVGYTKNICAWNKACIQHLMKSV